jgi:hypothetical protein
MKWDSLVLGARSRKTRRQKARSRTVLPCKPRRYTGLHQWHYRRNRPILPSPRRPRHRAPERLPRRCPGLPSRWHGPNRPRPPSRQVLCHWTYMSGRGTKGTARPQPVTAIADSVHPLKPSLQTLELEPVTAVVRCQAPRSFVSPLVFKRLGKIPRPHRYSHRLHFSSLLRSCWFTPQLSAKN